MILNLQVYSLPWLMIEAIARFSEGIIMIISSCFLHMLSPPTNLSLFFYLLRIRREFNVRSADTAASLFYLRVRVYRSPDEIPPFGKFFLSLQCVKVGGMKPGRSVTG